MTFERRATVWFVVASIGLLAGLTSSQPALVAVGAGFLVPLLFGLAARPPRLPEATVRVSADRVLEGGRVELELTLAASDACPWLDVELRLPERLDPGGAPTRRVLALRAGESRTLEYAIECPRWGAFRLAPIRLSARDRLHLRSVEVVVEPAMTLRVYPSVERLRRLAGPRATRPVTGSRPAAVAGEGIEFAELRFLAPGERARRVNWRATAARDRLLVSDRLPERSSDVVVFLDAFGAAGTTAANTLDDAVRAVASLTEAYLRRRDRVGLLRFGGDLEWIVPGSGLRQQYRIADALLESELARTYRWRDTSLIPRRILPPQSLVVALTPRLDWRFTRALVNLRRRGYQVAIIELDPLPYLAAAEAAAGEVAWRTWLLERDSVRTRLAASGMALALWRPGEPIAAAVEAVAGAR
ncbi:MAG: DUF58 domain-containing protein [Gaiella sp.]